MGYDRTEDEESPAQNNGPDNASGTTSTSASGDAGPRTERTLTDRALRERDLCRLRSDLDCTMIYMVK